MFVTRRPELSITVASVGPGAGKPDEAVVGQTIRVNLDLLVPAGTLAASVLQLNVASGSLPSGFRVVRIEMVDVSASEAENATRCGIGSLLAQLNATSPDGLPKISICPLVSNSSIGRFRIILEGAYVDNSTVPLSIGASWRGTGGLNDSAGGLEDKIATAQSRVMFDGFALLRADNADGNTTEPLVAGDRISVEMQLRTGSNGSAKAYNVTILDSLVASGFATAQGTEVLVNGVPVRFTRGADGSRTVLVIPSLPPNATVTVRYTATLSDTVAAGATYSAIPSVTWKALPGASSEKSSGPPSGARVVNIADPLVGIEVLPDASSRVVGTAAPTGGVQLRVEVRVPAGTTFDPTVALDYNPG